MNRFYPSQPKSLAQTHVPDHAQPSALGYEMNWASSGPLRPKHLSSRAHGAAVLFVVPRLPLGPVANAHDGGRATPVAVAGQQWSHAHVLARYLATFPDAAAPRDIIFARADVIGIG
jgi:hypothetical protein